MSRIVVHSTVVSIFKRIDRQWVSGVGPNATFKEIELGFYLHLQGSHEAIYVGFERPEFDVGDKIKITIERDLG